MARCSQCGNETEMYIAGSPLCTRCDGAAQTRKPPQSIALAEANERLNRARQEYQQALGGFEQASQKQASLGIGNPGGIPSVEIASRKLTQATAKYASAMREFVTVIAPRRSA